MTTRKNEGQVTLTQMLKALDKDVAVGIERKLKKLSKKKALKVPLNKNKASQVERKAAYSVVTKEVSRWEPIVDQNRRAKQLKFPLDQELEVLPSTAESIAELKPNSALEKEVQDAIKFSKSALHDNKELTKAEEKYLKSISSEEAQERHRELQKMRVLLSSFAAKMRRQKIIKSKSYRRLLKRERIKKHMKQVESNKDSLIEEIERLQRLRAKERASLKHKNTGKWAKHAKFRAKYDEEARKAMLEQIGFAEKLLEKPVVDNDSEEDDTISEVYSDKDDDEEEEEAGTKKDVGMVLQQSSQSSNNVINDRLIVSSELINDRLSRKGKRSEGDKSVEDNNIDDDDEMDDEDDEEDDQRKLMSEAFADDDVIAEFQKDKHQVTGEEQPKDVDLFLPGWGDWAGPGIKKVNKRIRSKYIIKAKKIPRRDDNLGNVIISEQADNKMKEIMVKKLPRGFKNDEHLTKILTRPTAATFINQSIHRESIKPRITTKMGTRIDPMNQKMLQGNKAKWA